MTLPEDLGIGGEHPPAQETPAEGSEEKMGSSQRKRVPPLGTTPPSRAVMVDHPMDKK